ncbi:hypothetical protein KW785_00270 [Candidatus Parcubacteria bacterium]|nr:hypothetical protein [Candidatus Parcubacteria bacterium]
MTNQLIEIERKFRLDNFHPSMIPADAILTELVQDYLLSPPGSERRVRAIQSTTGIWKHIYNEKGQTGDVRIRTELKRELSEEEYRSLLEEVDPQRATIRKLRHTFPHAGQTLELDKYHAIPALYIVEHEMEHVGVEVVKPDGWQWTEVTNDRDYGNYAIARLLKIGQATRLVKTPALSSPQA